jgi:hypothetical protein
MATSTIRISEELLTEWSISCVVMNHICTLIQDHLPNDNSRAGAVSHSQRTAQNALSLHYELRQYGARNSNAKIDNPRSIEIQVGLADKWTERCDEIYRTCTILEEGFSQTLKFNRPRDLIGRVKRRAEAMFHELRQAGAEGPVISVFDE